MSYVSPSLMQINNEMAQKSQNNTLNIALGKLHIMSTRKTVRDINLLYDDLSLIHS